MKKEEVRARIEEVGIVLPFACPRRRTPGLPPRRFSRRNSDRGNHHDGARPIEVISDLARNSPELIVGAGTLFDVETAGAVWMPELHS